MVFLLTKWDKNMILVQISSRKNLKRFRSWRSVPIVSVSRRQIDLQSGDGLQPHETVKPIEILHHKTGHGN